MKDTWIIRTPGQVDAMAARIAAGWFDEPRPRRCFVEPHYTVSKAKKLARKAQKRARKLSRKKRK